MLFETGATFKIYHELLSETEPIRIDESTEFKIRFTVYFIIIPRGPSRKNIGKYNIMLTAARRDRPRALNR